MSIKDLFDKGHSLKFVKNKTQDGIREDLESIRYIDSYSDANYFYVEFIKKYPDDDLVPSVKFELDNLKPLLIKTESLINNK